MMKATRNGPKRIGVIGAGVAGLMAANGLAKSGCRVTLFDRARYPGGSAGFYPYRGHTYPTGATLPFGLEPGGPLRRLLDAIGLDLPYIELEHSMAVILEDRIVRVCHDPASWREELVRAFPENAAGVVRFWTHLADIANAVYHIAGSYASLPIRRPVDFGNLPRVLASNPSWWVPMIREANWTVERALQKYGLADYAPFRRFLDAQLVDAAQTNIQNAAWFPSAIALDIYRKGIYTIPGGLPALSQALLDHAVQLGVDVRLSHTVASATHRAGRWTLVTNRGTADTFDAVINASGTAIDGANRSGEPPEPNWGAVRLDALVPRAWVQTLGFPVDTDRFPYALQVATRGGIADFFGDPDGALYITFHPAQPDEADQAVSLSIHTSASDWMSGSRPDYVERKHRALHHLLRFAETVLPGFLEHVKDARVGTPRTYHRYLHKSTVGGTPLTVANAILHPAGARTNLPGWYLAGDTVFPGPGTLSAALSGFYGARAAYAGTAHLIR